MAGCRHDPAYTVAFPACMNPTSDICFIGTTTALVDRSLTEDGV